MLSPQETDERWLCDADHLVTTSERLESAFGCVSKPVYRYSLGVDPSLFHPAGKREGGLVVGWAGNPLDPAKRLDRTLPPPKLPPTRCL